MEVNLRDWLESRGKAKSAQKIGVFASLVYTRTPGTVTRTPGTVGCFKKQTSIHGSAMSKSTINGRLKSAPQRKLFNCDNASNSCTDGNDPQREENGDHLGTESDHLTLAASVCMSSNCDPPNCDDFELCSSEVCLL